jgi:hypothetical protein
VAIVDAATPVWPSMSGSRCRLCQDSGIQWNTLSCRRIPPDTSGHKGLLDCTLNRGKDGTWGLAVPKLPCGSHQLRADRINLFSRLLQINAGREMHDLDGPAT